jgi:hypothetical protein
MNPYIALAQLVLYAVGALLLYRGASHFVVQHRVSALSASVWYWVLLALAPSLLTRAAIRAGNYIYVNGFAEREAAWDVGLAMWLYVSMSACYVFGVGMASFASFRFFKLEGKSASKHAT